MDKRWFVLVVLMVALAALALALSMGDAPKDAAAKAANQPIQPAVTVNPAPLAPTRAPAGNRSGEELYKSVCSACHDTGVAGAPKIGDNAAWAQHIAEGLDGMLQTATTGIRAMPPKGGSDATQEELKRAIVYMTNKSGANFK